MTSLYALDIDSFAKPVKAGKSKKVKETPAPSPEPAALAVKEKKPPTEKQLAARAKLAENRRLKLAEAAAARLQLETEIKNKEEEINAKELEKQEKKRIAAEKRKAKKAEVTTPTPPPSSEDSISEAVDEALAPKKTRKRKATADPDAPPQWVHKFVESVILEKSKLSEEKKPIKQIKEEAKITAQEQWKDGFTKDRVNHEVDNHMNRLYGMIFTRK